MHLKDEDLSLEFVYRIFWAQGKLLLLVTRPDAITPFFSLATDPNESALDMIHHREYLGPKVKPIENLLNQLKVSDSTDRTFSYGPCYTNRE